MRGSGGDMTGEGECGGDMAGEGSVFVYLNNGCGYKLNVHTMCGRKRKDNWVM